MHEYSIVQALLDQCEEHARTNEAEKITRIEVKIGVLSGVEPHLLETAFNTFKERTICDSAEFVIQIQPVVIFCSECSKESVLSEHDYSCPRCGSALVRIIDGEDMFLMRLEME
ncbi:[NiFe] hydrogenase nickel incorporation protein HypA [Hydrogenimonas sp.]|nr:[NiFe] hydrogenase nickel incorporation protein HypA [Hydrogenimonas sp.]